jgi:dienelactone hydrolase
LIDLLTEDEEVVDVQTAELRFNVAAIIDWIGRQPGLKKLDLGYFGASTGAAALEAAAERPNVVRAVVSRGGRPDFAGTLLKRVLAPTLFIVGGNDTVVLDLNYSVMAQLRREDPTET